MREEKAVRKGGQAAERIEKQSMSIWGWEDGGREGRTTRGAGVTGERYTSCCQSEVANQQPEAKSSRLTTGGLAQGFKPKENPNIHYFKIERFHLKIQISSFS